MISEKTKQGLTTTPTNNENRRLSRMLGRFSSLRGSRLVRHWRATILPALLIILVLVVVNWRLRARLGPEEPFDAFTFPYEQTFVDVSINRWFTSGGKWTLQAGTLAQTDNSEEPAKIFVPKWLPESEPYHLAVELTFGEGTQAAGINFNAQYPQIHNDHQRIAVVRTGDQLELQTGSVNEVDGFQAQTSAPIGVPSETLKLDLVVENEAYDVLVNGQLLVQQRPLTYADGLVGLFTINGPAKFDNLTLQAVSESFKIEHLMADPEPASKVGNEMATTDEAMNETEPAAAVSDVPGDGIAYASNFAAGTADGWVVITGDWRVENGRFTQFSTSGYDFSAGYEGQALQAYSVEATLAHLNGMGGGLLFNMASPNQIKEAHIVRYSDRSDAIVYGYFDGDGKFTSQGFATVAAPGTVEHVIKVVTSDSTYDLYLDGQAVANAIPLNRVGGHVGLVTAKSSVAFGQVTVSGISALETAGAEPAVEAPSVVQPEPTAEVAIVTEGLYGSAQSNSNAVATPVVETAVATTESNRGSLTASLNDWVTISGQWEAQDGVLVQSDKVGFDLAAGYAGNAYSSPDLQVTITHLDGTGAGVLFNMPAANSLPGAHMVRFADWADALVWGYFDEVGQFKGQGYAKIEAPGTSAHTIRVQTGAGGYNVYLDGQQVASNLPLFSDSGHIGLITSKAKAAFGPINIGSDGQTVASVAPAQQVNTLPQEPGDIFGDIETISGEWVREGIKLSQLNSATYDFSISTGVYAGVYTLETAIVLPEDPQMTDAGGGILFHMPERDSRTGSHMVRLAGRDELIWGYYDQNGAFIGQGRQQLGTADQSTHNLKIVVDKGSYRIVVDGQDVAQSVPLKQQEGWIGLVSYRGPVTFDGISVTFGTAE